jgi:hypothetical protein
LWAQEPEPERAPEPAPDVVLELPRGLLFVSSGLGPYSVYNRV